MRIAVLTVVLCAASVSSLRAQPSTTAVEVARIGCVDCSGPQLLTRVHSIAVAHSRVYVIDGAVPHVRVFDLSGKHVLSFGRAGDGPGEFRFPFNVNVRPDSIIEVVDLQQSRLTVLTASGAQLSTRQVGLGMLPILSTHPLSAETYGIVSSGLDSVQRVVRLSPTSPAPFTLSIPPSIDLTIRGGRVVRPAIAARPGSGFAIGQGAEENYRILILSSDGAPQGEIRRSVPRIRKSQAEVAAETRTQQAVMQRMRERVPSSSLPRVAADEYRRHFSGMAYDEDGRLWVRTLRRLDATVYDVFDGSGRFMREVVVPGNVQAFAVSNNVIAAATQGEAGVPNVVLYRVN